MNTNAWLQDLRDGFRHHRRRTAMVWLGMVLALCSMSLSAIVSEVARRRAESLAAVFGTDVIAVLPAQSGASLLTRERAEVLRANLPGSSLCGVTAQKVADSHPALVVAGVDEHWGTCRPQQIVEGRGLDALDVKRGERVVLLPGDSAEALQLHPGQPMFVGEGLFTVAGISDRPAGADFGLNTTAVLVPWTALPEIGGTHPPHALDTIFVRTPASRPAALLPSLERLLRSTGLAPEDFRLITPELQTEQWRRMRTLVSGISGVLSFALFAASTLGLAALLAARTRARRGEIALRRALGARPADIALWIWGETSVMALAAMVCALAASAAAVTAGLPSADRFGLLFLAFAVSAPAAVLMTFAAAVWPALRASRMNPSEALRSD